MFTLLFIVLIPLAAIDSVTVLETYATDAECQSEKKRIMAEMEKVYPGDTTWTLQCRLTARPL